SEVIESGVSSAWFYDNRKAETLRKCFSLFKATRHRKCRALRYRYVIPFKNSASHSFMLNSHCRGQCRYVWHTMDKRKPIPSSAFKDDDLTRIHSQTVRLSK